MAKFSELEEMVVPGGVFHEVTGDISVFAPGRWRAVPPFTHPRTYPVLEIKAAFLTTFLFFRGLFTGSADTSVER